MDSDEGEGCTLNDRELGSCCGTSKKSDNKNDHDRCENTPLHDAAIQNDENVLLDLLNQHQIDINARNYNAETPLILALSLSRSHSFIMCLLQAGADVNIVNKFKQNALHMALLCSSVDVLHELIKKGADIDAQDKDKRTPLHYAVENDDLEAVCMLLYYQADVSLFCNKGLTAFSLAVYCKRLEIAEVLFNYYDDFSDPRMDEYALLQMILYQEDDEFNEDGDSDDAVMNVPTATIDHCVELFELVLSIGDHNALLNNEVPSLMSFIMQGKSITPIYWVKLLYLLLETSIAFELLEDLRHYSPTGVICVYELILSCNDHINLDNRIKIMNICFSLGREIKILDVNLTYFFNGFNEELEIFLYCGGNPIIKSTERESYLDISEVLLPHCFCIFSLEHDLNIEAVNNCYRYLFNWIGVYPGDKNVVENCMLNNVGFFALPLHKKNELLNKYKCILDEFPAVYEKLIVLDEIPTLAELSRNQTRNFIFQTHNITQAYQYHDIVKRLNLPNLIRDILRFKMPLY